MDYLYAPVRLGDIRERSDSTNTKKATSPSPLVTSISWIGPRVVFELPADFVLDEADDQVAAFLLRCKVIRRDDHGPSPPDAGVEVPTTSDGLPAVTDESGWELLTKDDLPPPVQDSPKPHGPPAGEDPEKTPDSNLTPLPAPRAATAPTQATSSSTPAKPTGDLPPQVSDTTRPTPASSLSTQPRPQSNAAREKPAAPNPTPRPPTQDNPVIIHHIAPPLPMRNPPMTFTDPNRASTARSALGPPAPLSGPLREAHEAHMASMRAPKTAPTHANPKPARPQDALPPKRVHHPTPTLPLHPLPPPDPRVSDPDLPPTRPRLTPDFRPPISVAAKAAEDFARRPHACPAPGGVGAGAPRTEPRPRPPIVDVPGGGGIWTGRGGVATSSRTAREREIELEEELRARAVGMGLLPFDGRGRWDLETWEERAMREMRDCERREEERERYLAEREGCPGRYFGH